MKSHMECGPGAEEIIDEGVPGDRSSSPGRDGDGNRVSKRVTSGGVTTTTSYLIDDLNPTGYPQVIDELTNGVVSTTYTYGFQRISEDRIVSGAFTPSFYVYDGEGNVRQLASASGTVTDSYDYDAFGNEISSTGSTPNSYLYRGEAYDPDLGLYYLRARYYNPITGRFVSRDPDDGDVTDPKTLHRYLYAGGDPVNRIDPSGRDDLAEVDLEEGPKFAEVEVGTSEFAKDLALCFTGIGLTVYSIAEKDYLVGGAVGGAAAFLGCYRSLKPYFPPPPPPEPPQPPPPPPPPPPGLPPGWCGLECWNPPPGTPIN
ncbi:MAG TPA: RHS repeat-associated core domain-containing protein [Terracidiphilus sp.]|jgi:RHS repeat-associated protein|nr:RHS repeat-associated core domain-containing protein [Terracidiphilus sp.]